TVYLGGIRALAPNGTLLWSAPGGGVAIGADGTLYSGLGDRLLAYKTGGVGRPTAGYLRAAPDLATAGGPFSLRAYDVRDETAVNSVSFYRDTNGNGILDTANDELVGTNTIGPIFDSGLWRYYWGVDNVTAPAVAGTHIYFAQATDSQGHLSNVVST